MKSAFLKRKILAVLLTVVMVFWLFPSSALATRAVTDEMQYAAQQLNIIRLFRGTDNGFELEKAPDRVVAFVMLIRLIGKEAECLNESWTHPFSDVPGWADLYIGYAYEKGLTSGVGGGRFGSADLCSAQMYSAMALRALGYSDSGNNPDFTYAKATETAVNKGVISQTQLEACKDNFLRGDLALISANMMTQPLKGTDTRLIDSLIASGAVRQSDADAAKIGDAAANSGGQFGLKLPAGIAAPNVHNVKIQVDGGMCQFLGTMSVYDFKNYCGSLISAGFLPPYGPAEVMESNYMIEYYGERGNDLVHLRLERAYSSATEGDVAITFGVY